LENITSINTNRFLLKNSDAYDAFIWLGKDYLQLAITDTEHNKIEAIKTFEKNDGNITQQEAQDLFRGELLKKARHCYIGLESKKFTLIPESLFSEKNLSDYLRPLFKLDPLDNVASQKIIPVNGYGVFTLKQGTESLLQRELKNVSILHAPSSLLIAYQQLVPPNKKNMSFVRLHKNEILVTVFQDKKLLLHTNFDIEKLDDAVYHYLNTLEQLSLDKKSVSLNILGNHSEIDNFNNIMTVNVEGSKFVNRLPTLQYDDAVFSHPTHHFFNLFALVLCA
jgi:hypothetical protein